MTATKTVVSTDSFIFKDNNTYLSQTNWRNFFATAAQEGFTEHIGAEYVSHFDINFYGGIIQGMRVFGSGFQSLTPVTNSEVDNLYGVVFNGTSAELVKYAGISSNANNAITFLHYLMLRLSDSLISFRNILYTYSVLSEVEFMLPIAYGVYGHGYWDLSQLLKQSGKPFFVAKAETSSSTSIETPLCGRTNQNGLSQIYGNHRYSVTIAASYTLGEYHLYPVPVCSMDPATIYITNQTSGAVTIKLPLSYRDMFFDYFTDNNWTESSGFLTYSLAAGSEMAITMNQINQSAYTSGGVSYPRSFYTVSQLVKSA